MKTFGLETSRVRALVDAVAVPSASDEESAGPEPRAGAEQNPVEQNPVEQNTVEQITAEQSTAERFALGAWSTLVEPGDGDAGVLVAVLGGAAALSAVIEQHPAERIAAAIAERDGELAERIVTELPEALARWRPRLQSTATVHAFEMAARIGARLITPTDPAWPSGLHGLGAHAPLALWLRGTTDACESMQRSIALVGARAATGYGEHVAMEAAAGLVDRGFAIVSGAAYGIDGMAHRSALASKGDTIAFLAGGVDRFYPSGHDALLTRIAEHGAVLSEMPCGAAPTKWRFLQRNRLIAAASQATVVLEAGRRSGSLNTAGHAAALGRPLGAVPGPVTSPASVGCHRLIRDYDAVCVTGPAEMAELVEGFSDAEGAQRLDTSMLRSAEETRVLDALSRRSARPLNDIARRAGMTVAAVGSVLGILQLEGGVAERTSGWIIAAKR